MRLKRFKDKSSLAALVSGMVCFLCSLWVIHSIFPKFIDAVFLVSFLVASISAISSFPRRKSLRAFMILLLALWWSGGRVLAGYHSTHTSPDGRYKLVGFSMPGFAFPGGGSDAPGYVQLQDKSGDVLEEGYLGMIQYIYDVRWGRNEVEVGPRGDGDCCSYTWRLPE